MNNIYQNVPNDYGNKNSHYNPLVSNCYGEKIRITENEKVAVHMGDGWCTFPDLDNFDSDRLLRALTLKEPDSCDSIWDPNNPNNNDSTTRKITLSISALRQLEALFNLSQLLFGLSRAETVNYTFRDLQLRKYPHSFKKSGFKQLNIDGRIDFYAIFEQLVQNIIEEGGLEVTLLIYKNPVLPMVRQKCLDLISNVATVPSVACKIMRQHSWFLDHLLIMVRDGDIISDKIPALSVLIRLLKVMLTERMMSSYMKLVDMQYIDCLVDIFENPRFTETSEYLPFFIKFEFITMQSLTVILGDPEYSQFWSDKAKTHLLNYCMIVLLKAAGAYPTTTVSPINQECIENINHIFYAEQHSHKHSLAHTIMTVTELLRNDENMKQFYRYHRPFKQLIVQLYKKYGAKSQYIRTDPGISYALNHLMRVLYIKNSSDSKQSSNYDYYDHKQFISAQSTSSSSSQQPPRICSNPECKNEETKYKSFKECSHCNGKAGYCSSKCRKEHISYHRKFECTSKISSTSATVTASSSSNNYENYSKQNSNKIYDYLPNSFANRRNSENLFHNNQDMDIYGTISSGYSRTSKRLSKYASLNENHRRVSLNLAKGNSNNYVNMMAQPILKQSNEKVGSTSSSSSSASTSKPTYAKHTSSMKEIKSSNHNQYRRASHLDDDTNFKSKLANTRNMNDIKHQHQQQQMDETNSIHFLRPLKTSTALCLADLTRKHKGVVSDTSSTASGESSTKLQPIIKKFKSSNTRSSKEQSRKLDTSPPTPKKDSTNLNLSNHKRRHSATATILTTTKTTTTTTTTKTKAKISESADVKSSSSSSSSSASTKNNANKDEKPSTNENKENKNNFDEFFYHGKQETSNNLNINTNEYKSANFFLFKKTPQGQESQESYSDDDDNDDTEDEVDDLSVTSSSNTNTSSTNSNKNAEKQSEEDEEEDEEEVEGERLAIRSNLYVKNNYRSSNDDEQDRLSKFKVVKEFEKTLELVQNASNYKLLSSMSTKLSSISNNDENLEGNTLPSQQIQQQSQLANLIQPQLSLASLCYDEINKDGNESDSNGESEEDESNKNTNSNNQNNNDLKKTSSSKLKNFNFIINNSIESHMLTNSFHVNQASKLNRRPSTTNSNYQYVDEEEMSLFKNKNDSLNNPSKIVADYKTFKIPLLTINGGVDELASHQVQQQNVPLSLQPINEDNFVKPAPPPALKSNKFSELKVFNNLDVENQPPIQQQQQTTKIKSNPQLNALLTADLPKNSTPIFTDSNTAAILLNKRKQLLNAKLDLTIAPPSSSVQILNIQQNEQRKPTFLVPKVPTNNKFSSNSLSAFQKEQDQCQQQQKTTQSSTSAQQELPVITLDETIQLANGVIGGSGALNLSKIYSIETAVSTDLVSVAKTEIPKDLKKCFKDEIKKDKSKCIIS